MTERLPDLSGENRRLADRFLRELRASGRSRRTVRGYENVLRRLGRDLDAPIPEATREDIVGLVADMRKKLAEGTVTTYAVHIKRFYKWLNGGEYPEEVEWLKTTGGSSDDLPDEILSPEEVQQIIESCDRSHDRAMVATLYESGLRGREFLGLNVGSVEFDERMGRIILPRNAEGQKTGQRRIPLVHSVPHLQEWLNRHPLGGNDDPLWISFSPQRFHERLSYSGFKSKLKRIAEEAGIEKRVYPHLYRHSRATEVAKKGFSEAEMRIIFGWKKNSESPSKYIHLAGRDVDDKFKRLHGIVEKEEEEKEKPMEPVECPRCDYRNPAGGRFCTKCGLALDLEAAKEIEEGEGEVVDKLAEFRDADVMDMLETITKMYQLAREDPEIREKLEKEL